ncbi:hypothetical protein RD00_02595 [Pseudomonas amygdali pv. tabaci]|nr:hypothetical protein RD00_02595 [Pseudomonas amygdali pv. tabaci]
MGEFRRELDTIPSLQTATFGLRCRHITASCSGVVQGIGDGRQVVALVIAVISAFARTVRKRCTCARLFHHRYLDLSVGSTMVSQ